MAKVTITVEDDDAAGMVNIRIESEPGWPGPAAEDQTMTAAQHLGLIGMEAITKAAKGGEKEEEFDLPQPLLVDPSAPLV
jgi:hypothetical protein